MIFNTLVQSYSVRYGATSRWCQNASEDTKFMLLFHLQSNVS